MRLRPGVDHSAPAVRGTAAEAIAELTTANAGDVKALTTIGAEQGSSSNRKTKTGR